METQIYASREGDIKNSVYHEVKGIQKVIYESPTKQRIIFQKGEIELSLNGNELNVLSRVYLPRGKSKITKKFKKLIPNASYLTATKNDIIQRFTDLTLGAELERQEIAMKQKLDIYFGRQLIFEKRRRDLEKLAQFSKSMEGRELGAAAS